MRRDLFGSCDLTRIFFDKILNCLHTDPTTLCRVEESVLMTFQRNDIFTDFNITLQCFLNLRTKVYNHFIPTFSGDLNSIVFEIHILNIKPHTFRNSNSGSKQESNDCQITLLCLFIIYTFLTGQLIPTMFNVIKQKSNLICIKPDDAFVMDFGNIDQYGRICLDHFPFVKICIKTSKC